MPRRKPKSDESAGLGFVVNPNFNNPLRPKPLIEGKKPLLAMPPPKDQRAKLALRPGVEQQFQAQRLKQNGLKKQDKTFERTSAIETTSRTIPDSTTRISSSTSSTTKPNTTSMAKKDKSSTNREDRQTTSKQGFSTTYENQRLDKNRATVPAKFTDFNQSDDGKGYFMPTPNETKVSFRIPVKDTVYVDPNQVTDISGSDVINMFFLNAATIAESFFVSNSVNPVAYDAQYQIFNRMSLDVLNSTRSGLISDWTFANFRNAMGTVAEAVEFYYTLDSILSQNMVQKDVLNNNRTADNYRLFFSTSDVLELRTKLQNCLKGCWFPPNYSQFIRWFYQSYKTGTLNQSAQYRYIPGDEFLIVNNTRKGSLATKITALCNALPTYNKIYALLANVYPEGSISVLPPSCSNAVYDEVHHEIYVNEPLIFVDANNTYTAGGPSYSIYPVAYTLPSGQNNDIPYYQMVNPTNGDTGFPFACQTIVKISTASGNVATTPIWTGLKCFIALGGTQGQGSNYCNKFFFINISGSGESYPRANNFKQIIGTGDAHNALNTGTSTILASKPNSNYQRVYFNNYNAPRVFTSVLVDNLFSLKPMVLA